MDMAKMYCVYDDLAKKASPPFFADNDDVAVRQFRQLVEPLPPFARADFKLFAVGEMDLETMEIVFAVDVTEIDTVRKFKAEIEVGNGQA